MGARSVAVTLFFCGCGATSESVVSPPQPVDAPASASPSSVVIAEPVLPNVPPPLLVPEGTLDERIERASKAMRDTRFQDVSIIVELGRLQLVRDAAIADSDGPNDAARGKRNAQRAVAVDDKSAQPRLLLALATAQSFRDLPSDDAQVRVARLKLVELATSSVPESSGVTEAAIRSLSGFIALENGDRTAARSSFEAATKLDPQLAAAWAGLGDVLRSGKDYPHALDAYRRAAAFLPDDKGIEEGMALSEKGVVLELPKPGRPTGGVLAAGEALAPPPPAVPSCPPRARKDDVCAGLDALARAGSPKQLEDAANAIVDGYNALRPLCSQNDPACGEHVAPALLAAGRAFRTAGLMAKSIATIRMLVSNAPLPGGKESGRVALLEIADQYFAIGVFDTAADYYDRYARERGPSFERARDRAAFIRSAFQASAGPVAKPSGAVCRSPLLCGVRYLLAERRWAAPKAKP